MIYPFIWGVKSDVYLIFISRLMTLKSLERDTQSRLQLVKIKILIAVIRKVTIPLNHVRTALAAHS